MWCEIRVADQLDAGWSAWLDGLTIRHTTDGDTILAGSLADQAALHGVLARVRDLGLDLRSVDCRGPALRERRGSADAGPPSEQADQTS